LSSGFNLSLDQILVESLKFKTEETSVEIVNSNCRIKEKLDKSKPPSEKLKLFKVAREAPIEPSDLDWSKVPKSSPRKDTW